MQTDLATTAGRGPLSRLLQSRRLPVSAAFVKFLVVGAIAYFINQGALFLLYDALPLLPAKDTHTDFGLFTHPDVRLLIASALAVEVSIVFKFYALEHWTFSERPRSGLRIVRFLRFNGTCFLSPVVTVATVNVMTPVLGVSPYISNTAGTLLGFAANWFFSAYIIWPHAREAARASSD